MEKFYNSEEEEEVAPFEINRVWVYRRGDKNNDDDDEQDRVSEYDDEYDEEDDSSPSKEYTRAELKRLARKNRVYRPSRFRKWRLGLLGLLAFVGLSYGTTVLVMRLKNASLNQNRKPVLNFRKVKDTYKFKIVQFADLHFGEEAGTEEGRKKDQNTWRVIDSVLKAENPDLVVLTGDQISAEAIKDNANEYYYLLGEYLSNYGIPWALTFGSHDDADYHQAGSDTYTQAKYSREDLLEIAMSFPLSLTQRGPHEIFGLTNYMLEMNIDGVAAANIYMFDTGGGQLPSKMSQNQINWFYNTPQRLPAIAFQYHPTNALQVGFDEQKCIGAYEESVTMDGYFDPGIADALSESSRVYFLAAGHTHGNDYCCRFSLWMQVCFGAHSGYGGYGDWQRGARVYELSVTDPTSYKMDWNSWVRLESGELRDSVTQEVLLQMTDGGV